MAKAMKDLSKFKKTLPYSSEIFGIYQPLLGWKSKRAKSRNEYNIDSVKIQKMNTILAQLKPKIEGTLFNENGIISDEFQLRIAKEKNPETSSKILKHLQTKLEEGQELSILASETEIQAALNEIRIEIIQQSNAMLQQASPDDRPMLIKGLEDQIKSESLMAGVVHALHQQNNWADLKDLLEKKADSPLGQLALVKDPDSWLNTLNPTDKRQMERVGLSPIGIVHLYRQYFFEFDTFLGQPVDHIWLSPGSSVELIETTSRKTTVERTSESSYESTNKSELSITDQDELSDSIKQENQQNLKFGASATVNQGWILGSATTSTNFGFESSQKTARESAHKHMRNQSEKISSEIKKNYKSSFKMVTETTDTSSRRYVLNNNTPNLLNYEMRRKMRQVGVQVQDIGTYLCWQTYVDDPGAQLGVSELIHIAKSADIDPNKKYEPIKKLEPFTSEKQMTIPYIQTSEDRGSLSESYSFGTETDTDANEGDPEKIQYQFREYVVCDRSHYTLKSVTYDYQGNSVVILTDHIQNDGLGKTYFDYRLAHVNFGGKESIAVKTILTWEPDSAQNEIIERQNSEAYQLEENRRQVEDKKAYYEAVKQRVTAMSKISSRKFDDLREEERIVVYRKLIDELLPDYYNSTDNKTRHKLSELINAIFDIDKMLYFVSPEYWRPRMHESHQVLGRQEDQNRNYNNDQSSALGGMSRAHLKTSHSVSSSIRSKDAVKFKNPDPKTKVDTENISRWGGGGRKDNYFITEDSEPAKKGSSLGWLLQLDGDERRNSFLNAPWVKTVIPVRPGKEMAAINWLKHIEGDDIDFDIAQLEELASKISEKHEQANQVKLYPDNSIDEPNATDRVRSTPVDKVYEHGFYPLLGGFKANYNRNFEIIDQWLEILPTDQIVPVEVTYDPKTGLQL